MLILPPGSSILTAPSPDTINQRGLALKPRNYLLLILTLIALVGCGGQINVATTTPTATSTPDFPATETYEAFIAEQTAVVETQADLAAQQTALAETESDVAATQAALIGEQEVLAATQTALAGAEADLQAGQTAFAENQAALTEEQEAVAATQAALTEEQEALAATQAALAESQADLAAQQTAVAESESSVAATQVALASEQADVQVTQTAVAGAQAEVNTEREALMAEATAIYATATELARPTATPTPTNTPTPPPTPTPVEVSWRTVELPDLGLRLDVPDSMSGPETVNARTVGFSDVSGPPPSTFIIIGRTVTEQLLTGVGEIPADARHDPVTVLNAALNAVIQLPADATLDGDITTYEGLNYPAAQMRVRSAGLEEVATFVLYYLGGEDWALVLFSGAEDTLSALIEPVAESVMLIEGTQSQPPPQPEQPGDALGLNFTLPEGWAAEPLMLDNLEAPALNIGPTGADDTERGIMIARGSAAQMAGIGFPEGETDPVAALQAIVTQILAEAPEDYSGGRYREVQIGDFLGAWTQIRGETRTLRYYLFPVGADDWLLIGARATADAFGPFSRTELRDFLASLELQPDEGVALGLDFVVPEGWTVEAYSAEGLFNAPAVRLLPPDGPADEAGRMLIIARGTGADFAGGAIPFPEDATDPAAALEPVADYFREQLGVTRGVRVESLQLGDFFGAFASLRNDDNAARLYLFLAGQDDWIFIYTEAHRDAFNAFNRAELRDFLASLQLAAGTTGGPVLPPPGPMEEALVLRVVDGDTIVVLLNGHEENVRYIGIDTPETHHPREGAAWLGYEATHFNNQFVHVGETVFLERDITDRDIYNRLLRYIWAPDENGNLVLVQGELLRAGLAHLLTYDERRYLPYFMAMEREAQEAHRGLWGEPPPPPPVDPIAQVDDQVWAANPDGDLMPMLYDAAALGNEPDPIAFWPNNVPATVRDVFYVYPDAIDPTTGQPVSEDKVGYWYWLEINDFRGWVPERWLLLEEPETVFPPPETRIIAYDEPYIVGNDPLPVLNTPGGDEVLGELPPDSRPQVKRLGIGPDGEWWLWVDTDGLDGWVPLSRLSKTNP